MNATTYAVDIAKSVFQVHWVEPETGEILRRKLTLTLPLESVSHSRAHALACRG